MTKNKRWAHPRKRAYDNLEVSIRFLPSDISNLSVKCTACGESFIPNWGGKRHSTHPVSMNLKPLLLVPIGVEIRCENPNCHSLVKIDFPNKTKEGITHTYIDEAYRHLSLNRCLTNYSSISIRPKHLNHVIEQWDKFKEGLVERNLINHKFIHVTELKDKSSELCIEVLNRICEWLNNMVNDIGDQGIRLYSSIALGKKLNPTSKEMKRRAFEAYFILTQHEATRGGVQHNYQIEDDGKQGWINEMMVEYFHTLAFPFICNGIQVPQVEKIDKGEGLSELADVIAFVTTRHCSDLIQNKVVFFDSANLGVIRYCMVNKNANSLASEGVPVHLL